jgi:hypothetical protein
MSKRRPASLPPPLSKARRRLEQWRSRRRPRARLPEELWSTAVELARRHGLYKTAKALRLDYYGLKKRVDRVSGAESGHSSSEGGFVEVLPAEIPNLRPECTLELENGAGGKMRIYLKGFQCPDLPGCLMAFGGGARGRGRPLGRSQG